MPNFLKSTALRQDRALDKLEQMAEGNHPFAGAIANLLNRQGDALRSFLVFSETEHEGITAVTIKDTQITTVFTDVDDSESSPLTEHTLATSTH